MIWDVIKVALSAIPAAATNGYAFGAYALVITAYVLSVWRVSRNKNLLDKIHKLPPKDRLSALELEMGGVRLATGISPEQWVRSRIHKYYFFAFVATCGVIVAIAGLATLKGAEAVQAVNNVNTEFQRSNNGQSLSGSDLQNIKALVEAAVTRNTQQASNSYSQLSEPARAAYARTAESTEGDLFRAEELQPIVGAREAEPNDDIFNANNIRLNATISAQISSPSDVDYFAFTTVDSRRDYIDVVLNNESTTLEPQITVFNPDKSKQQSQANSTSGGDVSYAFVAQPNTRYYVSVAPYGRSAGNYRLTVRPRKAYDQFEPNDDILHPAPILVGKTIEAGIMDGGDVDYYTFESGNTAKLKVVLENRSATLVPQITVLNPDKSAHQTQTNSTAGGDVSYAFAAQPNSRYYIKVAPYFSNSGQYALTVRAE